jgi:hypothetical protein
MERHLGRHRVNTVMTPNVRSLTANLVANFVTVVIPQFRRTSDDTEIDHHLTIDEIEAYRVQFRRGLARHGEVHCLDRIEIDASGNCRIHFFCLNEEAVPIPQNTAMTLSGVACGSGNSAGVDAEAFVAIRLDELEQLGRLRARDPWWLDEPTATGNEQPIDIVR